MNEWEARLRKEKEEAEKRKQRAEEAIRPEYTKLSVHIEKFKVKELLEGMNSAYWKNVGKVRLLQGVGRGRHNTRVFFVAYQLYHDYVGQGSEWTPSNLPFLGGQRVFYPRLESPNLVVGAAKEEEANGREYLRGGPTNFLFIRCDSLSKKPPEYFHHGNDGGGVHGIDSRITIDEWNYGKQKTYSNEEIQKQLQDKLAGQGYYMNAFSPKK